MLTALFRLSTEPAIKRPGPAFNLRRPMGPKGSAMYQKLATTPDPATAGLLHSLLSDAGISVLDVELTPIGNLAFGDSGYYVEVEEAQLEQAAAILREQGQGKWIMQ